MRCKEPSVKVSSDGSLEVCQKHYDMLTEAETIELFGETTAQNEVEQEDALVTKEVADAASIIPCLESLEVKDEASLAFANGLLAEVSAKIKELKDKKKELLEPNKIQKARIDALFAQPLDMYELIKGIIKDKVQPYVNRVRADRKEALSEGNVNMPDEPNMKGIAQRTFYSVDVQDILAVSPEWLKVDEKKVIDAYKEAKKTGENFHIPGLRVIEEKRVL